MRPYILEWERRGLIREINGKKPQISPEALVLEGAVIAGDVKIARRANIWYNAVLRGDLAPISIGEETSIQDNVVIHADRGQEVVVGDQVTIGHGAVLHGCKIGNRVIIGMNAVVLDGAVVGDGSIVGANSLVKRGQQIPPGSIAVGSPAKVLRQVTPEETEGILRGVADYQELHNFHAQAQGKGAGV
ncbi:MAG: gamma carbonic anhydrase family protein [Clostridia bacterium]|nr:gamma carbonic anhydrase family protein [Clostridia bacterium]